MAANNGTKDSLEWIKRKGAEAQARAEKDWRRDAAPTVFAGHGRGHAGDAEPGSPDLPCSRPLREGAASSTKKLRLSRAPML